jgi:predicted NAD-dependent protein-ADP-ribosyltransferase YbiA (DUF1768 family)
VIKLLLILSIFNISSASGYPTHWWKEIPQDELEWWEISPHKAQRGVEVILSKRNELGILSNFAPTPFIFRGKRYASLEGFWQAMKFPEDKNDPRYSQAKWPNTRVEVEQMVAFEAKTAGDFGSQVMKKMEINWVSFENVRFPYRTTQKGKHYKLIREAMRQKMLQNQLVKQILMSTGDLILLPDHQVGKNDPPAWRYYQIWMELRKEILP